MKKFIVSILILGVIIGLSPVFAETQDEIIKKLQKQVSDKDAIIMEQIKVIMFIKDNFKQQYSDFNKTKYSSTDGFPTDWLEGERTKILETCKEASSMGYENPYCKFVR